MRLFVLFLNWNITNNSRYWYVLGNELIDIVDFFSPFCFASPAIIGVKVYLRQTDKFFDTIYRQSPVKTPDIKTSK